MNINKNLKGVALSFLDFRQHLYDLPKNSELYQRLGALIDKALANPDTCIAQLESIFCNFSNHDDLAGCLDADASMYSDELNDIALFIEEHRHLLSGIFNEDISMQEMFDVDYALPESIVLDELCSHLQK